MALTYLSEKEAEQLFDSTLVQWAKAYKYSGCSSPQETRKAVFDARTWAWKSTTATELLQFVQGSKERVYVVGMHGGFQCFNSTEGPDKNMPVIFIDLDGKLTVNVRTPHNLHLDPIRCTQNTVPLDNRIALLHEFGHAKQWIERPLMFDKHFKANRGDFAKAIREGAIGVQGQQDHIRTLDDVNAFKPPAWGTNIEMDNMARHEWPICRELGLPIRANYRDINATLDPTPTLTSQIRRKALEEERRRKEEAEQTAGELSKLKSTGANVCDTCGASFPSRRELLGHKLGGSCK